MIEIRLEKLAKAVTVLREESGPVTLIVPENLAWAEIHPQIAPHLIGEELALAKKIWCDDDFPRKFGLGEDYLTIKADK